jgi:hypothetical protein
MIIMNIILGYVVTEGGEEGELDVIIYWTRLLSHLFHLFHAG